MNFVVPTFTLHPRHPLLVTTFGVSNPENPTKGIKYLDLYMIDRNVDSPYGLYGILPYWFCFSQLSFWSWNGTDTAPALLLLPDPIACFKAEYGLLYHARTSIPSLHWFSNTLILPSAHHSPHYLPYFTPSRPSTNRTTADLLPSIVQSLLCAAAVRPYYPLFPHLPHRHRIESSNAKNTTCISSLLPEVGTLS